MYHSISESDNEMTVRSSQLAEQMDYLARNGFKIVSLREACRLLQTNANLYRTIVLTFDDGYDDFLQTAVPILQHHGFTATLFVVTGLLGGSSVWSSFDKTRLLLSKDDLRQINIMGFSLGSHTLTHVDLTSADDDTLLHEITNSRETMIELGETFFPFAYPGGRFTQREIDAVKRAGYDCGVIVGGRWGNGYETDIMTLKREPVLLSDSIDWFSRRVKGYYEWHFITARRNTR